MIEFEDGSTFESEDWARMMAVIKQRAKEGKSKPVRITQNGVAIAVKGFNPIKKDSKPAPEHANYIESNFRNWKIRVWTIKESKVYGCNYFKDEDIRYLEVPFDNVKDENGVFRYVSSIIEDID